MQTGWSVIRCAALSLGLLAPWTIGAASPGLPASEPPDWREQILYFVLTDRFDDGDPRNNDQGAGEYDPKDRRRFSGGDLAGLQRRLDYIQGLGATGVWITPPVANQWWNGSYGGYHGYWASDFARVDPHLGTLQDYRQLARALHGRGMTLVQDIVLNHTGDFFRMVPDAQGHLRWQANAESRPMLAPRQPPFGLNDPRQAAHRRAGIYHWTPDVADYGDRQQELNHQMSGLDDLNTENPRVRRALRQSYGHWLRSVGVDAFRLDTAFYVPPDFLQDFLHSTDPQAPGMQRLARQLGRPDFFMFGEGFAIDRPGESAGMRKIEGYVQDARGRPVLPGMLHFTLYGTLGDVMARGQPPAQLAERIRLTMQLHSRPHWMPTFVDNHDVDRFLAGGTVPGLRQALAAIMTLPGIPVIYYGTEQGFKGQRDAMFASGYGAGGRDHFDTGAPLYRAIAELAALRKGHRVFTRGVPTVLQAQALGPGAMAWRMDHAGHSALVVMNTADHPVLLDALEPGWGAGAQARGLLHWVGDQGLTPERLTLDARGQSHLQLPPRSVQVWLREGAASQADAAGAQPAAAAASRTAVASITPAEGPPAPRPLALVQTTTAQDPASDCVRLQARGEPLADGSGLRWELLRNGRPEAIDGAVLPGGLWQACLPTDALEETPRDPAQGHRLVLAGWQGTQLRALSAPLLLPWQRPWQTVLVHEDPAGDDRGPAGRYQLPLDPPYARGTMDLRRVTVQTSGRALRLQLQMGHISQVWKPANGFDHLALTIYLQRPDQDGGLQLLPLQQAMLPQGMRWHQRLRVHGWSNALFTHTDASATHEGTPWPEAARVQADPATGTITLEWPRSALQGLPDLRGLRLYISTWDYDNGYRSIAPEPGAFVMGGGTPDAPRILDDTPVLTLP